MRHFYCYTLSMKDTYDYIIGIDEAGRGPLAGPVVVGAVMVRKDFQKKFKKVLLEIKNKDSKKLSAEKREAWFQKIKKWKQENKLDFHVALISNKIIDTKGISLAIKKGIQECLTKIVHSRKINPDECLVLLDGSLKAPEEFIHQKTIIKGDEKHFQISLASICAKVTRDAYMKKAAKKYPQYSFEVHKGYGTLQHRILIKKHGVSKIHRQSFIKRLLTQ
jgi:ribonuclease HII